jgi:hypothetical protein
MVSSEVQRTLVKSPPELWAELSDPEALARHLGELGEIRITRTKPEERVEWEAANTSGTVLIKPSGWGTKVTLSVTREIEAAATAEPVVEEPLSEPVVTEEPATESPAREEPTAEDEPDDGNLAAAEPPAEEPAATESTAEEPNAAEPLAETPDTDTATTEPSAEHDAPQEPRRGFFARLFSRRRPKSPETALTIEPPDSGPDLEEPLAETEPAPLDAGEPELAAEAAAQPSTQADLEPPSPDPSDPPAAASHPDEPAAEEEPSEPAIDTASEPLADLAAELQQAEEVAAEEVKAVLTAVLDRLGAAHHRPFSRS